MSFLGLFALSRSLLMIHLPKLRNLISWIIPTDLPQPRSYNLNRNEKRDISIFHVPLVSGSRLCLRRSENLRRYRVTLRTGFRLRNQIAPVWDFEQWLQVGLKTMTSLFGFVLFYDIQIKQSRAFSWRLNNQLRVWHSQRKVHWALHNARSQRGAIWNYIEAVNIKCAVESELTLRHRLWSAMEDEQTETRLEVAIRSVCDINNKMIA